MVMQEHSSTSMAVKAVVAEAKKQLSTRFDFLKGIPDFFYDLDKGVSDQFKQYYAKIPISEREGSWICLAYSYDSADSSEVHPRKGLGWWRPVAEYTRRKINVAYVQLPLLISVLCNDSKTFNALSNFLIHRFDWSFTTEYMDLLWPEWTANKDIPLGWYVRPTQYNGHLYRCSTPGLTSDKEPDWTKVSEDKLIDNTCEWTQIEPDRLKVKAGDFAKNDAVISNPIENGVMYQQDFGFTLSYTDYDDAGELEGVTTEVMLDLLEMYNPIYKLDSMTVTLNF